MKKKMVAITVISCVAFSLFLLLYFLFKLGLFLTMAITFGTILYHFAMRLIIGSVINIIYRHKKMNYLLWWFRPRKFEKKLHKLLQVRKWRKYVPTYSPETFDFEKNSKEAMMQATCQAEIIHETIIVFSFLPIAFAVFFDAWIVFIITSVLSAIFDGIFVIMQRFNRPMLYRLLKKESSKQ